MKNTKLAHLTYFELDFVDWYRSQGNSADADVIHLLVQHGADTKLLNHDNKTAIDLCHGNEMASWLKRAGSSAEQGTSL